MNIGQWERGLGGETVSLVKLFDKFVRFRLNRISSISDRLMRLSDLIQERYSSVSATNDMRKRNGGAYSVDEPAEVIGKTPQIGQEHVGEMRSDEVIR